MAIVIIVINIEPYSLKKSDSTGSLQRRSTRDFVTNIHRKYENFYGGPESSTLNKF